MQKPKHYTTVLIFFYEKPDVKSKMLSVIQNFAFTAGSTNQRNPTYKLSTEEESDVEHGFVENLCQLFALREEN